MAIKIDGQDLLKKFIGWQEIVRIYKNGGEIRPNTVPPTPPQPAYHIVGDFTQWVIPSWWLVNWDYTLDSAWISMWTNNVGIFPLNFPSLKRASNIEVSIYCNIDVPSYWYTGGALSQAIVDWWLLVSWVNTYYQNDEWFSDIAGGRWSTTSGTEPYVNPSKIKTVFDLRGYYSGVYFTYSWLVDDPLLYFADDITNDSKRIVREYDTPAPRVYMSHTPVTISRIEYDIRETNIIFDVRQTTEGNVWDVIRLTGEVKNVSALDDWGFIDGWGIECINQGTSWTTIWGDFRLLTAGNTYVQIYSWREVENYNQDIIYITINP